LLIAIYQLNDGKDLDLIHSKANLILSANNDLEMSKNKQGNINLVQFIHFATI